MWHVRLVAATGRRLIKSSRFFGFSTSTNVTFYCNCSNAPFTISTPPSDCLLASTTLKVHIAPTPGSSTAHFEYHYAKLSFVNESNCLLTLSINTIPCEASVRNKVRDIFKYMVWIQNDRRAGASCSEWVGGMSLRSSSSHTISDVIMLRCGTRHMKGAPNETRTHSCRFASRAC